MPEHYRKMVEVEEERLRRLERSLAQERASLDGDREKLLTEMSSWRARMEEEEKQARQRVSRRRSLCDHGRGPGPENQEGNGATGSWVLPSLPPSAHPSLHPSINHQCFHLSIPPN